MTETDNGTDKAGRASDFFPLKKSLLAGIGLVVAFALVGILLIWLGFGGIGKIHHLVSEYYTLHPLFSRMIIFLFGVAFLGVTFFAVRKWTIKPVQNCYVLILMSAVLVFGFVCLDYGITLSKVPEKNAIHHLSEDTVVTLESTDNSKEGSKIVLLKGTAYTTKNESAGATTSVAAGSDGNADSGSDSTNKLPLNPNWMLGFLLYFMYIIMVLDGVRVIDETEKSPLKELRGYIHQRLQLVFMRPGQPYVLLGIIGTFWGLIGLLASIDFSQIKEFASIIGNDSSEDNAAFKAFFDTLSSNAVLSLVSSGVGVSMAFLAHFLVEPPDDEAAVNRRAGAGAGLTSGSATKTVAKKKPK